jgi:hypothetical protein
MRVLITGSCAWTDGEAVFKRLAKLPGPALDITIIHGCAMGVDTMAGMSARMLGYTVEEYPPLVAEGDESPEAFSKACEARNIAMTEASPDLCIAFWNGRSHGTFHTMYNAVIRKIPVDVVMEHGKP